MDRSRVSKAPKNRKPVNTYKTSDRRIAAGVNPSNYLNNKIQVRLSKDITDKIKTNTPIEGSKRAVERFDPKTGRKWHDKSLIEWDPSHFRLFVGNIGPDVTEDLLIETFIKYKSLSKVKVPIDDKLKSNKGYAFISFADADDYLKCYKEMNGKYVGLKPITLERAKTEIGEVIKVKKPMK